MPQSGKTFRWFSWKLVVLALCVPVLWIVVGYFGFLSYIEYATEDWRFKARGEIEESPVKLIYVDMDSETLEVMGERPIPRSYFAYAVEVLFKYGKASVVGVDIVFSKEARSVLVDKVKMEQDTDIFRKVIEASPHLVLAAAYTPRIDVVKGVNGEGLVNFPYIKWGFTNPDENSLPEQPEIGLIGTSGGNLGLINVAEFYSPGSILRWVPVFAKTPGPTYLTLALEMVRVHYGVPMQDVEIGEDAIVMRDKDGEELLRMPLTEEQLVEVNWFSRWNSPANVRYSMKTVLAAFQWMKSGTEEQKAQAQTFFKAFNNAFILIGPTDPMLHDLGATPFDNEPVPRVSVHGNLLKTIFGKAYLHRADFGLEIIITLFLTAIVTGFGAYSGRFSGLSKVLSAAFLIFYIVMAFLVFDSLDWVLPIVMPVGSAASTAFLVVLVQLVETERQRAQIKGMFGTYVSPDLVDEMVEKDEAPHLGGEDREITALFSDIEGFTSICEDLKPSEVIHILNEYLSSMTEVIQEEHGTLDKYIGDAIVSMFGAPVHLKDHEKAACRAVCRMQRRQKALQEEWLKRPDVTDKIKKMRTRIGVNSGLATIGNMGSEVRFNYTMLGDNVNLASRCEMAAKLYGIYSMATEATRNAIKPEDGILFRKLDRIIVKGKTEPVIIYEVMGFENDVSDSLQECAAIFEGAFEKYLERNWDDAIASFEKAEKLEYYRGEDVVNPSKLFIERCRHLKENGPGDSWDGVYVLKGKSG